MHTEYENFHNTISTLQFQLWWAGINPKSLRKITIGKATHRNIRNKYNWNLKFINKYRFLCIKYNLIKYFNSKSPMQQYIDLMGNY